MTLIPHLIRNRRLRQENPHNKASSHLGLGVSILVSLIIVFTTLSALLFYQEVVRDLPSLENIPLYFYLPDGAPVNPTRLYDRNREQLILTLENPGAAGKRYLRVSENDIPEPGRFSKDLQDAAVAWLEPGFWNSPGVYWSGWRQGTSQTIAQKLVVDLLLWDEPAGIRRNLRERLLAAQMTERFGSRQILEWYLNSAHFGQWIYGADAATRAYFGKPASDLSLAEAAYLIATSQAPEISPWDAPSLVSEVQKQVLEEMQDHGFIDEQEAQEARAKKISIQPRQAIQNIAPAFTDMVLNQLETVIPRQRLERGGLDIYTTLDASLQYQAQCAMGVLIARLEGNAEEIGTDCTAANLLPTLFIEQQVVKGGVEMGAVLMEPKTGQILALVGSGRRNPADLQPGSILTPFLYLTGFTRGLSPATLMWDLPENAQLLAEDPDGDVDQATEQEGFHGPVRLRMAMANDYLPPAWQVVDQTGAANIGRILKQFGLSGMEAPGETGGAWRELFPGTVSLLDIVQTYGVIANQGILAGQSDLTQDVAAQDEIVPKIVLDVRDSSGLRWLDWSASTARPIVSAQLAYLVTHVLSDEAARWLSLGHPNALEIGRPAAAKIGQTDDGKNTWVVGYIPQLVGGVWVGNGEGQEWDVIPEIPSALWHALMQTAARNLPTENWKIPPGISFVDVCDPSGLLPTIDCPKIVTEAFLFGSEPSYLDQMYRSYQINRATGNLATVFTPPELIDERVYLVLPPSAQSWARQSGMLVPPSAYDALYDPSPPSPDVVISSPRNFNHVRDKVMITGTADGKSFEYYRLQVGKGLNPQYWVRIGEDVRRPVTDGRLGEWDTTGLSGVYIIELILVGDDEQLEMDMIQVTVDNQAPEVKILFPETGQQVASQPGGVLIKVDAVDDLAIAKVEFYLDERLVSTLVQPPYVLMWQGKSGEHKLKVRALDLAGNEGDDLVSFQIKR